jgi:hypothetical protein
MICVLQHILMRIFFAKVLTSLAAVWVQENVQIAHLSSLTNTQISRRIHGIHAMGRLHSPSHKLSESVIKFCFCT